MKAWVCVLLLFCSVAWASTPDRLGETCAALMAAPPTPIQRSLRDRVRSGFNFLRQFFFSLAEQKERKRQEASGEGGDKSSEGKDEQRSRRSSKHQSTYQAHNKDTDLKPDENNGPLKVAVRVRGSRITYFVRTRYQAVDPVKGTASLKRIMAEQKTGSRPSTSKLEVMVTSEYPVVEGMAPLIPAGRDIVNSKDFIIDETGNYQYRGAPGRPIDAELADMIPRVLNDFEQEAYTSLEQPVNEDYFPTWLRTELDELRIRHKNGAGDIEVARSLVKTLREKLIYRVDKNSQVGVQSWLYTKTCQCDGAAIIAVSILRQVFKIPSRTVSGFIGSTDQEDPDGSVVVLPTQGHAWIEVYNAKSGLWIEMDPTPKNPDREKEEDPQQGQFKLNSPENQEGEESKKDQAGEESTLRPKPKENSTKKADRAVNYQATFENVLAGADSPSELLAQLNLLNAEWGKNRPAFLGEKMDTLVRALKELPSGKWDEAIREVFQNVEPDNRDVMKAAQLNSLQTVLKTLANSSHAHASLFSQMSGTLERILPRSAPQRDDLETVKKILHSISDRPLETAWIYKQYPNLTKDAGAASSFIADLGSPRMRLFLMRNLINKYLDLDLLLTPKQQQEYLNFGTPKSYGEGDMYLRDARELDSPDRIYRDGTPAELDYFRFISGDLLEILNFTEAPVDENQTEFEYRTSTILVADMSGSNSKDMRGLVRDATILRYMDGVANQFDNGQTGSQIILLPYRGSPEEPIVLDTKERLFTEFAHFAAQPRMNGSSNNTALAMTRALQLAEMHKDKFARVNIILITDGEETIDTAKILQAQRKVSPGVEINLVAITLVTGNKAIDNLTEIFIENLTNPSQGKRRHHISGMEVNRLVETSFDAKTGKNLAEENSFTWNGWSKVKEVGTILSRQAERIR